MLFCLSISASDIRDIFLPSARGEFEITDLNNMYLQRGKLNVKLFGNDTTWIDAGTFDSLLESSQFVADRERELKGKILCPEAIALEKGFVTAAEMSKWVESNKDNEYFQAIKNLL